MKIALTVVSLLCILLMLRLLFLKLQVHSIRQQLKRRIEENSQGFIYLEVREKNIRELIKLLNGTLRQESMLRAEKEIKEREFRDLITNISHDLRTPLTVMKGYLQLLSRCEIDKNGREYLNICFRHTDELEGRIRQFFEYSYWNSRQEPVMLFPVNIVNLVTEVMTDFIPVFEEKGLSMRLADDVQGKVWGDEELLKHMMQNLLKNCVQYASGEVTVSIFAGDEPSDCLQAFGGRREGQIPCQLAAGYWAGTEDIQNSGKGGRVFIAVSNFVAMDSKLDASLIFERFYAEGTARGRSTGLGLSIVKLLAEKMGGEVFAKREGEVFTVGFYLNAHGCT